ncbi:maleylacetate reductase [Azospirillum sp. RWY-5-1]|uniref:Maleylacetate reductase n=1 Tax=Azospirillum oleiclasticum TaxID=2735135 RepID=A0ABX2TIX2_9PROT|nr:maleylacetate reductase [Azospirillum oleiclasticum]NYZ14521.1 maleylacetate reductase [Azospirillum oleiclasticum]NYZ24299.1 maleylacetate reductase [Azospirillum oleiclasticum]
MRQFETPGDVYNAVPPRVVFGAGTADRIDAEVARLGGCRALVVSTPGRGAMAARVVERLGDRCIGLLPEAVSQVPIELARRGQARATEMGADCLVSVGGGASIGLGKAIALELGLPIVAVPTTYSGSEMTGFCGITIDGVKRMHKSLRMLASTVVYDPTLSLSLPVAVSAASAMNALAHCIDVIYVPTASPVIVQAAVEGARVIVDALPRVARQPGSVEARGDLLYGAYLAGAALTGGFALQHGVAHVLGGTYGVAHGLSHALVLPHVAAYNTPFAPEAMGRVAAAMGVSDVGAAIFDTMVASGLPTRLGEVGFSGDAVAEAARITVETDNGSNPGPVTVDAVRGILEAALEGRRPAGGRA